MNLSQGSKKNLSQNWIIFTGDNGKKGGNTTAILLDFYKAVNRATCDWTSANVNGDPNEAFT